MFPVLVLLFAIFDQRWLVIGNRNTNYICFQCFAYGIFVTVMITEFVGAKVKRDKVRRMAEKGTFENLA